MGNGRRGTGSRTPGNAWEALPAGNRVGSTDTMDSQLSADDRAAAPDEPANVEATLRELAETIGAVFWLTDWETRTVLYASPKWERLWGVPREALFSEDPDAWASAIHPEDRQRVLESFRSRGPQGEYEEDFRIVHPDGSVRWLHERAYPVRDERGAVLRIAGVAWDDTKRKEAERSLVEAQELLEARRQSQLASLTGELLLAEENERRRLARELHDGINQLVTVALLKLGRLKEELTGSFAQQAAEIERIVQEAGQAARSMSYSLSPPVLHDLGLLPALEWLTEDVEAKFGLRTELLGEVDCTGLEDGAKLLLFRALRELLVWIAEHGHSSSAQVRLRTSTARLEVLLEGDGQALDPDSVGSRGIGLSAIGERLNHLGGAMELDRDLSRGSRIRILVPLKTPESSCESSSSTTTK